jgi:ribosomal protein S18 acetylase RimI-like enzyme
MTADLAMRETGLDDLDRIFALTSACDIADSGEVDLTRDDVRAGLVAAGASAWALVDATGEFKALVWIERNPSRPLIEHMLTAQAEDPAGRKLQVFVNANARGKSAVLTSLGATVVRYFYKMVVEFDGPQPPVSWPADAVVQPVKDVDDDLRPVHAVVREAFQDHWEPSTSEFDEWVAHLRDRETFDPSLIWLVEIDGVPAAALIGASSDGEGFVATLGVRRPYRGRGLGRSLLQAAFTEFIRRGHPRAALFVDSANPSGAVRLYESVGMRVLSQWDSHEFPAIGPR